jgi:hypothetical protein
MSAKQLLIATSIFLCPMEEKLWKSKIDNYLCAVNVASNPCLELRIRTSLEWIEDIKTTLFE